MRCSNNALGHTKGWTFPHKRSEDMYSIQTQKASKADGVPTHFIRTLNEVLRAAGISPIQPTRRLVARGAVDEKDAPGTNLSPDVPTRMGRVVVFIEEHLEGPLSVERLADEANLSKYYFSRLFRDEVGQTPWAYVREARIQKAKTLLDQGASPATAALEAGFFDQSHLTNVMKALEGKTPTQYQEERHRRDRKDLQE